MPPGPRFVATRAESATWAGRRLQVDEALQRAKRWAVILLALAIFGGAIGLCNAASGGAFVVGEEKASAVTMLVVQGVVCAVYICLYGWARRSPLPALIVGFVLYCTMSLTNLLIVLAMGAFMGLVIALPILALVITLFVKALSAASRHRRLARQLEQRGAATSPGARSEP
jgi:hypothetical protein